MPPFKEFCLTSETMAYCIYYYFIKQCLKSDFKNVYVISHQLDFQSSFVLKLIGISLTDAD